MFATSAGHKRTYRENATVKPTELCLLSWAGSETARKQARRKTPTNRHETARKRARRKKPTNQPSSACCPGYDVELPASELVGETDKPTQLCLPSWVGREIARKRARRINRRSLELCLPPCVGREAARKRARRTNRRS